MVQNPVLLLKAMPKKTKCTQVSKDVCTSAAAAAAADMMGSLAIISLYKKKNPEKNLIESGLEKLQSH